MDKEYYVLKQYSWTDRRCLWSVLSRPFKRITDAELWLHCCKTNDTSKKRKKPEYFIVEKLSEEEINKRVENQRILQMVENSAK